LASIEYCLAQGAEKVFLVSHMGRPRTAKEGCEDLSLRTVLDVLREVAPELGAGFTTLKQLVKEKDESLSRVVLVENLRYYAGEERNEKAFARRLLGVTGAELIVLDAFPVMHRRHASVGAITRLGVPAVAGISLVQEIEKLSQVFYARRGKKKVAVVSGAKVKDKAVAIEALAARGFIVLVGGLIAANGYRSDNPNVIVSHDFVKDDDGEILGIGRETLASFVQEIETADVVVWAGPVSWIDAEDRPPYELPSLRIAWSVTQATERGAYTTVLGGDTGGFWSRLIDRGEKLACTYRSKGGGAALEFLATGTLFGIRALEKAAALF
jgi:phosphoglycerate kinase